MAASYDKEGWAHNLFLLSVSAVVYCLFLAVGLLFEMVASSDAAPSDDLYDLKMTLQSWSDYGVFQHVKRWNNSHATDSSFLRIFPSLLVCIFYVVDTYRGEISTPMYAMLASFGVVMLIYSFLQIPIDPSPWRFVFRYDFAVETLSLVSLVLSHSQNILNFSFLQAHIVLTRFLDVLPTLTALFWKKPQPHLEQKIRFVAIFLTHIYIFASGLQLFERLGDPLSVFRSTALELTMWNALYFTFVTVFTVGFGDFIPYTLLGRTWMVLVITIGVLLVSYKISKFHELSHAFWNGQGSFVKQDGIKHCVICGNIKWEYLKAFVEEFYSDHENLETELVVMSDRVEWTEQEWSKFFDKQAFYKHRVTFFRGSCMTEEDLARAKVKQSMAIFVLNNQHNPNVYVEDSETLKRILTIRSYSPETPVFSMCALTDSMFQIEYALDHSGVNDGESPMSESSDHSMLGEDESDGMIVQDFEGPTGPKSEAICMQDLEMSMLAGNVFCNGMSTLLSNLLLLTVPTMDPADEEEPWLKEYKAGTENCFHFVKIPSKMHETTYREIALTLFDHGVVLLATKSYFGDDWKPIKPDTKLSHSSIGLVITFLARIDLRSLIDNIADKWVAESFQQSESEELPAFDVMSHRTPSWHEIAGARLTGDGHDVMFFDDEYDELDELQEDLDGDADDENEPGVDDDDDFLQTPHSSRLLPDILPDPFNSPLPLVADLPNTNDAHLNIRGALTDGGMTSANDNPEEFSHGNILAASSYGHSISADDLVPAFNDNSEPSVQESKEDANTSLPTLANTGWQSQVPRRRSALRRRTTGDESQPRGQDGNRVAFSEFSSVREWGANSPRFEETAVGSPRSESQQLDVKRGLGASSSGRGSFFSTGGRSISSQELPRVPMDSTHILGTRLNLEKVATVPSDTKATLADFRDGSNEFNNEADDSSNRLERGTVRQIATIFEEPAKSLDDRARKSRGEDGPRARFQVAKSGNEMGIVYPGQASSSMDESSLRKIASRSEQGSSDYYSGLSEIQVCYGDQPLAQNFKNHIVVCVIGQMGMMNLKQFLHRLRAAKRDKRCDQQVVAICPVVTEENVQELSELDSPKISLIQGNSLSIKTLQSAQFEKASTVIILACEDKSVVSHMDSQAIYTIMTLDHLIEENANIFVCSMIDSEESLHLLRAPPKLRLRAGDLGEIPDCASMLIRRRSSRYSLRSFSTFKSHHGGNSLSKAIARRVSYYDLPRTTSTATLSRFGSRGIRQSRSFAIVPLSRYASKRHASMERFDSISARAALEFTQDDPSRLPNYGAAPLLVKMSTATLGKKSWYNGPSSNPLGSSTQRQDPTNPQYVPKKSRDDAFEKERYASGEMMISSMFIALLIREFSMSGLTKVVGKLFGTRLDTQPCWVRSIPVPKSWLEPDEDGKPLEYRDLCEKLLDRSCIPLGLYRCGTAPVRVFKQHENEDVLSGFHFGLDNNEVFANNRSRYTDPVVLGSRDVRSMNERVPEYADLRVRSPIGGEGASSFQDMGIGHVSRDPFADLATDFVQEHRPDELQTPPDGFSSCDGDEGEGLLLDSEAGESGTYKFVTSDRTVAYKEHEDGRNILPYVYTNPEPYTVVGHHDAIYVLVDPKIDLKHLK